MNKRLIISFLAILSVVFVAVLGSCDEEEAGEAAFEAGNLTVEPSSALAGQPVTVSADVTNSGDTEGTHTIILLVNGAEESRQNITLAAGAGQTVTFNLAKDAAGEYEIEVAGLKGELAVVDFGEIFEKTSGAMSAIDSYHFTCTVELELTIPEEALSLPE